MLNFGQPVYEHPPINNSSSEDRTMSKIYTSADQLIGKVRTERSKKK